MVTRRGLHKKVSARGRKSFSLEREDKKKKNLRPDRRKEIRKKGSGNFRIKKREGKKEGLQKGAFSD